MGEIVLSSKLMYYIAKAEEIIDRLTLKQMVRSKKLKKSPHVKVLDCVDEDDRIILVVGNGQLGMAIGKQACNLATLKKEFKKDIKIVEFDENPEKFVENIFKPYKIEGIKIDHYPNGKTVAEVTASPQEKGRIIGRSGRNIKSANEIATRHTNLSEVRVL
jgi:N utilization substance protein A